MFIGRKNYWIVSISKEILDTGIKVYTIKASDNFDDHKERGNVKTISFDGDEWEQLMEINKGLEAEE